MLDVADFSEEIGFDTRLFICFQRLAAEIRAEGRLRGVCHCEPLARNDSAAYSLRRDNSFSQGRAWKTLITRYISVIPLSGGAPAEHIVDPLPNRSASAIAKKVGAAARPNQSALSRRAAYPLSGRNVPLADPLI
jgi:hypothetical protein